MAKKDEILKSFLTHELLETKYKLNRDEFPCSIKKALRSDIPIIKAIALIIDGLEGATPTTDHTLRKQVIQYLNEAL